MKFEIELPEEQLQKYAQSDLLAAVSTPNFGRSSALREHIRAVIVRQADEAIMQLDLSETINRLIEQEVAAICENMVRSRLKTLIRATVNREVEKRVAELQP